MELHGPDATIPTMTPPRPPAPSRSPAPPTLPSPPDAERVCPVDGRLDLVRTLGPLATGAGDPTIQLGARRVRRASRTPDGPATTEIVLETAPDGGSFSGSGPGPGSGWAPGSIVARVRAWGPGAGWAVAHAPALLGLADDPPGFRPDHPLLDELARRFAGLRFGRTDAVVEALIPAVLGQKVTGTEARSAYQALVRTYGEVAPGPFGLRLQPDPARLARLPYHAFHPLGVERRRAETIRRVGILAARLETATTLDPPAALALLQAVPGIGPWTAAEAVRAALGDPDAVSIGDFHLPNLVCWALAHEPRGTDARMLELLEPWRGQRGRVIRLLEVSGIRAPAYGPRSAPRSIVDL